MSHDDLQGLSLEQLRRKADQAWEMAGLARQDGDKEDEARHTAKARMYDSAVSERVRDDLGATSNYAAERAAAQTK